MKIRNYIILGIALLGNQFLFGQLQITTQGKVGIGTNTPWERLHVDNGSAIIQNNGRLCRIVPWNSVSIGSNYAIINFWEQDAGWNSIKASKLWISSDQSFKTNIVEIKDPFGLLKGLEGIYFKYKKNDSVVLPYLQEDLYSFGFIAQQVEKIIPDIVTVNDDGSKAVDYIAVIPILVEAFKKQQVMIETQQQKLDSFKIQLENCCQVDSQQFRMSSSVDSGKITFPFNLKQGTGELFQNSPNPFKEQTTIKYQIKEIYSEASILIFDMQGLLLKNISLKNELRGEIVILGRELKPGMYIYSLIVDKKEVDTKRMILLD